MNFIMLILAGAHGGLGIAASLLDALAVAALQRAATETDPQKAEALKASAASKQKLAGILRAADVGIVAEMQELTTNP